MAYQKMNNFSKSRVRSISDLTVVIKNFVVKVVINPSSRDSSEYSLTLAASCNYC